MPLPPLPLQPPLPGMPREAPRPGPKPRITTERWFITALEQLALGGIDSVRVELLAETLGVTKGMFYARFDTRDTFLDAMVEYWRQRTSIGVVQELGIMDATPRDRLMRIFSIPQTDRGKTAMWIEAALRTWALTDERAATAIADIDRYRLAYLGSLLEANGFEPRLAAARAFLIYAFMIGDTLYPGDRSDIREACRDILTPL